MILVNNGTSHKEIEMDGLKVKYLPANTTSLIQPLDQGPIAALKKRYISTFLVAAMERDDDQNLTAFIKKWDLLKTSIAAGKAWSEITEQTLKNLLKDGPHLLLLMLSLHLILLRTQLLFRSRGCREMDHNLIMLSKKLKNSLKNFKDFFKIFFI